LSDVSQPLPCVARSTIEIPTAERIYAEMFREAEAERVADICAALVGNLPILRADNTHTPLKAGDIALLSPGHTELSCRTGPRAGCGGRLATRRLRLRRRSS